MLLGEGGLGKTDELEQEKRRLHAAGLSAVLADLGRTTDRNKLLATVLPRPTAGTDLTLLVDGFDEVFADVADIADVLTDFIDSLEHHRVSIRLASRPGVWSTRLERELAARWPDTTVLVLEPPSHTDVRAAADAALGADAGASFMTVIAERDLWSLAERPITLEFLLDAFALSGTVSGDRVDIYREGVARLASERHDRRLERRRPGTPTPGRVEAARSTAILSMFASKPVISTRPLPAADLLDLDDIAGMEGHGTATMDELAQSALLRPAGGDAVTWAHRSFAEFLAAERIRSLPLRTLRNLLGQPTNPGRIAPPMAGIASWVACTRVDLFDWLVAHDIEVLLDANLTDATQERRRQVAEAVIESIVAGRGFDLRSATISGLAHLELAAAIRTPLTSADVSAEAKAELLRIVRRTRTTGLADDLVGIVAGAAIQSGYGEIVSLGRWAVIALRAEDSPAVDDRLVEIASAPTTNRWIRADLLERLHPRRVDTAEMLRLLPEDVFCGFSSTFLGLVRSSRELAAEDQDALVALLDWLSAQPADAYHDHAFADAFNDAARAATARLEAAPVVEALTRLVCRHAEEGRGMSVPPALRDLNPANRRKLLAGVATTAKDPILATRILTHHLVRAEDFDHYVDLVVDSDAFDPGGDHHWLMYAARAALMSVDGHQLEATIEDVKRRQLDAADRIEEQWGADWRSQRAAALAPSPEWEAQRAAERAGSRFDLVRLTEALTSADWAATARELHKPIADTDNGIIHPRRLSSSLAWRSLDDTFRPPVIELAVRAVTTFPAELGRLHWIADALAVLADATPDRLGSLPGARWLELLGPMLASAEEPDICAIVVECAAQQDAAATAAQVIAAIRSDVASHQMMDLDRLGAYRPADLDAVLLELAADERTSNHPLGRLLGELLRRKVPSASKLAAAIAWDRPDAKPAGPTTDSGAEIVDHDDVSAEGVRRRRWRRAVTAAAALAIAPVAAVEGVDLLRILTGDWDFTTETARRLGSHLDDELFPSLSSDQIADLYLWVDSHLVRRQYEPGTVYDVDAVQDLPNTIIQTIGRREDRDAVAALDRIAGQCSSLGIREYARRVQRAADSISWQPIPVAEIRCILDDVERRVLTTAAQLAELVVEAIEDYAAVLGTDATVRRRLWRKGADGDIPLGEEALSDELRLELQQRIGRRIAVHREVRVEPRVGAQSASDVDLLVTVFDSGDDPVACIIEVKANWFPKLIDRIAAQLVDRYLAGPATNSGVFAVLWFAAANWPQSDSRCRKALKDRKRFDRRLELAMVPYLGRPIHALVVDCTLERHQ